jgi:hypothetical protein
VTWPSGTGGGKLSIFDLTRPLVNERSLKEQAASLGLEAGRRSGRVESDESTLTYSIGQQQLTLYRASGALRYKDSSRWQLDDGESDVRFSDDEGVEIARRFVEAHRLLPAGEGRTTRVTRLNVASSDIKGESFEQRVIDLGVVFERVIDGVPVDGPGGKLVVYIDAERQVTGVDRIWRQIRGTAAEVDSLKPPQEVEERMISSFGRSARAEVTDVRFGYFEQDQRTPQRHLQPAYVVMVSLGSGEHGQLTRTVYVEAAATNALGSLRPRRGRPEAQPARPNGTPAGRPS